jgi:replicative DNA helicase
LPYDDDGPITRPYVGPTGPERYPPSNIDAERALLGALLANNKALDRAQFLEPHHFADPINGRIFEAIRRLIGENRVADPITLKTVFEQSGVLQEVGGTGYLVSLLSCMVSIIYAADYAGVVQRTWLRRELIDIGEMLVNQSFGEDDVDPLKLAMETVAMLDGVTMGVNSLTEHSTSLNTAMDRAIAAMEQASKSDKPAGISTGFDNLDARLGGLEDGLVYVLGGRPGMGKSALGHKIAINAAREQIGVLELSLEMSALQLGRRALSSASGVSLATMKSGQASQGEWERVAAARKELYDLPLTIDDMAAQTPRMIHAKARAAKRKHGLGLVMVDHLNLTRPDDDDAKHGPTHAIERASGMMLKLAKDLGVPVLLLVQLNRGVEGREDKRPGLADLRQSGAIEQDAYGIGFVYREEYYLQNTPERKENETGDAFATRTMAFRERQDAVAGRADIIWAKVRDGEPGSDRLYFDGKTTTFSEEQL